MFNDEPELIFGPDVNGKPQEGGIPPFYVSLNIHDKILHNAMLDYGASHNLMPKSVMWKLNLDITRPYKDFLLWFKSSRLSRVNQSFVYHFSSISCQEHPHGHCGGWCSTKIWHAAIQIFGSQASRVTPIGYVICHNFCVWTTQETVQRNFHEIYGKQPK